MLNQQTISILHSLKLFGMADSLEKRLADPKQASLSHAEFVGLLVQDEKTHRDNLRLRRLLKKPRLRQEAALEDIDYAASRGNVAARAGYTVLYIRAPRLFETLQQSRGDGSHLKALARLSRVQLLIIDDFLLTRPAEIEQRDLLEIIEDRYQLAATIIASQCPIGDWHPNLGDPTLADATCDRLLHNAYRIELRGDSMRTRPSSTSKNERREALENDQ